MKRADKIIMTLATVLMAACSLNEVDPGKRPSRNDIWTNPAFGKDSSDVERKIRYMTAFDYPDGYDWRSDTENGSVKCSLTVFADDVPVMKIPVGENYEVSSDPDMHRIRNGHLYTDYSTGTETVIKKDGQELFRFEGREQIVDMVISGEDVMTLGCGRKGNEFTLRRNGAVEYRKKNGRPFGRMHLEDGCLMFAFCEIISSQEQDLERYWIYADGREEQVAVRKDIQKVWDLNIRNGEICYLAQMTGISAPVLVKGEEMKALDMPAGMKPVTGRLFRAGNSTFIEMVGTSNGTSHSSGIWIDSRQYKMFSPGMTTSGICTWDDGIYCICNSSSANGGGTIFRCGETIVSPSGYTMMGNSPMCVADGIMYIGLSSLEGKHPLIWKDGRTSELEINGYICTMTVE